MSSFIAPTFILQFFILCAQVFLKFTSAHYFTTFFFTSCDGCAFFFFIPHAFFIFLSLHLIFLGSIIPFHASLRISLMHLFHVCPFSCFLCASFSLSLVALPFMIQHIAQHKLHIINHFACDGVINATSEFVVMVLLLQIFVEMRF